MAYTTIDDPSAHFQIALWTGNGSTPTITNDGNSDMQPDWLWGKNRTGQADHNYLIDSTRGTNKYLLSNSTSAEITNAAISSFNSDGFTLTSDVGLNRNSSTYVGWQWKANGGSRTTFSASGNQLAGGYQANTTAGFSIVDYTGNATNGATFPHGLGATPVIAIIKDRTNAGDGDGTNWIVVSTAQDGSSDRLYLNGTNAKYDLSGTELRADFDSNNVTLGTWNNVNASGTHIAYCFTPIKGYSRFGMYRGNGSADGTFVFTGFKPSFLMFKAVSGTENWGIFDNKRNTQPGNPRDLYLMPSSTNADSSESDSVDFLSNGFKWRIDSGFRNGDGVDFIYMAFAENPFTSSEGVPTTAG